MSNLYGANYHYKRKSSSVSRQFSDNVEVPKDYPNLMPNGTPVQKQNILASVQSLPAVLTDPKKGNETYNVKGVFFKPSGNLLVAPIFCF